MDKLELMMEADRRGILPPDKKAMLDEAVKRGIVTGGKEDQIPNDYAAVPPAEKPIGPLQDLVGAGETALTLGTGAAGALAGQVAGIGKSLFGGKYGTQEGVREGQDTAKSVSEAMTYQPRTDAGKRNVEAISGALDASKIAGLNPATAAEVAALSGPAATSASRGAASVKNAVSDLTKPAEKPMVGMGSAMTAEETIRRERAKALPVPIKLSKGEASRDFEQQRFEKETSKNSQAGAPLREHAADNVEKVIKNFESWVDETGAEAPDLISVGKAVDRPLVKRMESAKAEIRAAYDKAEKAGEMSQPVSITPLAQFVNDNSSAAKLAPVITAIQSEMKRLGGMSDGIPAKLPLNDIEKLRKLVVRLGKADDTNGHYAGEANKIIDAMTEGAGGDLYKQARGMFKDYAAEFKNQGAVRKLVSMKPGTTDRAVALEDVFNHSVLSGSNQDTANILRSLEKAGPEGLQAIKELKGQTINHLLGKMTENATRDIRGNPIPSFSKINNAVRSLDREGKLDLLFGKKGAEQIRDLKELVADIQTAPPGAVNTSTTAAVLMEAFGALATGRVPTATAKAISGIKQAVGDRALSKRVRDALIDPADIEAPTPTRGNDTLH